ncbi:uncharacterized protein LOC143180469 [Calliopsis andreniformis]|uniref:uncharacterized protein LOC143180469 n=1 Tax=Calliopsis andreniformis TaxID=337506 RepID=UPI003FCDC22F
MHSSLSASPRAESTAACAWQGRESRFETEVSGALAAILLSATRVRSSLRMIQDNFGCSTILLNVCSPIVDIRRVSRFGVMASTCRAREDLPARMCPIAASLYIHATNASCSYRRLRLVLTKLMPTTWNLLQTFCEQPSIAMRIFINFF